MPRQPDSPLQHVARRNPIHRVNDETLVRLCNAQSNAFDVEFKNVRELLQRALDDTKIAMQVPRKLAGTPAAEFGEQPFADLYGTCHSLLKSSGIKSAEVLHLHATNLAQRIQLLRAFAHPEPVMESVQAKVIEVVKGFPKNAGDIEVGKNPGDVLDPYILSATQFLLCDGKFSDAIATTVSHKALMMIEGLLGHLHEDIIGEFRGNVRCPEPRGYHQEHLDLETNPFPGADVVQPPLGPDETIRFHQVKSKTGSAKGGDGRRLGEQLKRLNEYYGGEMYYDALIGNTLRGHRSMRGVLRTSPETIVLVGAAAFRELTRSNIGPQLLMRVYQNAFSEAARSTGYTVKRMARTIVNAFKRRAEDGDDDFLEVLMHGAIDGDVAQQDSRVFKPSRSRRNP